MPLSDAAQRALEKAAAWAARVAERDPGLGDPDGPQPNHPSEKKSKALEKAKEQPRPVCDFLDGSRTAHIANIKIIYWFWNLY